MRLRNLLIWDMRFQLRYGFYLLYTFLTLFYIVVLTAMPSSLRGYAAAVLIFSDPSAMGLFFMGAIVLLEKNQRVTSFMAVTPLKAEEYVLSKVLSLNAIALVVAMILTLSVGGRKIVPVLIGTFMAGTLFTLCGVIVATKITSLNQFILATVPVEIVGFVPAILHLCGITPRSWGIYPANACMDLVAGREASIIGLVLCALIIAALFRASVSCVQKMWQEQGGVKI